MFFRPPLKRRKKVASFRASALLPLTESEDVIATFLRGYMCTKGNEEKSRA